MADAPVAAMAVVTAADYERISEIHPDLLRVWV
jgi:hypothetical protein